MTDFRLPPELIPVDGRFGCGPSKIRAEQLDHLVANAHLLGTSHRQQPVRELVGRVRSGLAELYRMPKDYEVVLGNGGSTAFWDAAAFSLIDQRSAHLAFGEFGQKFVNAASTPWLTAPAVVHGEPGTVSSFFGDEEADVFAYPHNETSTGAMTAVRRQGPTGSLTVVDATSAAGGVDIDVRETDSTTSHLKRTSRVTVDSGSPLCPPPLFNGSIASPLRVATFQKSCRSGSR